MIVKLAAHKMQDLLKNRVELTKAELDEVFKRKAVWHHGPHHEETSAVWKSYDTDKMSQLKHGLSKEGPPFIYVTNTHRAYKTSPSLKGVISHYHKFIKSTA